MAAAGSAIGLGNLWKFPYITWANEGGAFVLVYLICILAIGLPIMMAEILIGRMTQKSAYGAMREAVGARWAWVGGLGVFGGFVILSFYAVIAGWTLRYFFQCVSWSVNGFDPAAAGGEAFGGFVTNGGLQVVLAGLFMIATILVVRRGIGGGIERTARLLMPILFVILLVLLGSALTMKGAGEALAFIFQPDFSRLEPPGILEALGHAFFTLSLGMGAMITYGSYLRKEDSVVRSSGLVVLLDTAIALFATVIMFSVIFSVEGMSDQITKSTAGMLFITLPSLFYTQVPFGTILAPLFYLLVGFAALTSTISLLEVVVSYFIRCVSQSRGDLVRQHHLCDLIALRTLARSGPGALEFLADLRGHRPRQAGALQPPRSHGVELDPPARWVLHHHRGRLVHDARNHRARAHRRLAGAVVPLRRVAGVHPLRRPGSSRRDHPGSDRWERLLLDVWLGKSSSSRCARTRISRPAIC